MPRRIPPLLSLAPPRAPLSPPERQEWLEALCVFTRWALVSQRHSTTAIQQRVAVITNFLEFTQRPLPDITPDAYLSWMSALLAQTHRSAVTLQFYQATIEIFYEALMSDRAFQQTVLERHGFLLSSPVQRWLLPGVLWLNHTRRRR